MQPFTLPTSLKVGPHTYSVTRNNTFLPDEETVGFHDSAHNRITIRTPLPESQVLVTFIHELLHAINGELSEVTVDAIAVGLAQVLVDNKLLKIKK